MKGEGEVKLNMTVGKGEQIVKNCSKDKQKAIRSQLQSLKDSWANMLMAAMSCHRYGYTSATITNMQLNWLLCVGEMKEHELYLHMCV